MRARNLKTLLTICTLASFSAGCVTLDASGNVVCPKSKEYTAEFQQKAAREYQAMVTKAPHLVTMIDDYGIERRKLRACENAISR